MTPDKTKTLSWRLPKTSLWSWLNVILSLLLLGWGIWYLGREISFADVQQAIATAHPLPLLLGIATILITLLLKTWRWQMLFHPRPQRPPFTAAFWALMLGQFVNTAVSFLRIGELARVYALQQQTGQSKMRSLGTLVLEKTLDLFALILTLLIVLPFAIVPAIITDQGFTLGIITAVLLIALFTIAHQTQRITTLLRWLSQRLPDILATRILRWGVAGLEGLTTLQNPRAIFATFSATAIIAATSITTPWVLFAAFDLPFGPVEAALIHLVTTVASVLPVPIPAKLGFFEAAVIFMLTQFNVTNDAISVSYAILFHLVIILPQIFLGALAASRTNWRWQQSIQTLS